MTNYVPQPIDTSDVKLPEELLELTEQIAKNVHDVWAAGRIREGWVYGEERNNEQKAGKTPPFARLERALPRISCLQKIRNRVKV